MVARAYRPRARLQPSRARFNPSAKSILAAVLALVALMFLVGCLASPLGRWVRDTAAEATRDPIVELAPPDPNTRTVEEPVTAVVLIDQSGSTDDSDPEHARVSEAVTWACWVGRHSGNPEDEIGAVHFTSTVDRQVGPLTPPCSSEEGDADLFAIPDNAGGGTSILPGLEAARRMFEAAPAENRRLLVLFTDGVSDDLDQVGDAISNSMADSVWLVALNVDHRYQDQAASKWESFGLTGVLRMDRLEAGAVAGSLADIFMDETGQTSTLGVLRVR